MCFKVLLIQRCAPSSVFLEGASPGQRVILRGTRRVIDFGVDKLGCRVVVVGQLDECGIACAYVSKEVVVPREQMTLT